MKFYFLEKISEINLKIALHKGDAIQRLASQSHKILLLPENQLNKELTDKLLKLKKLIKNKMINKPDGLHLTTLGINNEKSLNYIKYLIEMENYIKDI